MPILDDQATAIELSPLNPFRPPDWRWQRYVRGYEAWDDRCRRRLSTLRPNRKKDLWAAIDVYHDEPLRRAAMEARILAQQPQVDIADRLQVRTAAINWFEVLFFDVRARLKRTSWITFATLKPPPTGTLSRDDVPCLWRHVGYFEGAAALDTLIGAVNQNDLARFGVDAYLRPNVRIPNQLKFAIAAARVPVPTMSQTLPRLSQVTKAHFRGMQPAEGICISPLVMTAGSPDDVAMMAKFFEFIQESDRVTV